MTYFRSIFIALGLAVIATTAAAQHILIMDRNNPDEILNDKVVTIFSDQPETSSLTADFIIKNNTDVPLRVFLRKHILQMPDSTMDYFCFYVKCWPDTDTTNLADTIPPAGLDYNFSSHVCHVRRFDLAPLVPGLSSITYTIFDNTSLPTPVEASVTVNYHLSPQSAHKTGAQKINTFPNPAQDKIRIQLASNASNLPYEIRDLSGRKVLSGKIANSNPTCEIDVSPLTSGMYTLLMYLETGTRYSKIEVLHR